MSFTLDGAHALVRHDPRAGGHVVALSDGDSHSSGALIEGNWYVVWALGDQATSGIHYRLAVNGNGDADTGDPALPCGMMSLPFQARNDGDKVAFLRIGDAAITAFVTRIFVDVRSRGNA